MTSNISSVPLTLLEITKAVKTSANRVQDIAKSIHPKLLKYLTVQDIKEDSTLCNNELLTKYNEILKPHIDNHNQYKGDLGKRYLFQYLNDALYVYDNIGHFSDSYELVKERIDEKNLLKIQVRLELEAMYDYIVENFFKKDTFSPFWDIEYSYITNYMNHRVEIRRSTTPEEFIKENSPRIPSTYNKSVYEMLEKYIEKKQTAEYEFAMDPSPNVNFVNIKNTIEQHLILKYLMDYKVQNTEQDLFFKFDENLNPILLYEIIE